MHFHLDEFIFKIRNTKWTRCILFSFFRNPYFSYRPGSVTRFSSVQSVIQVTFQISVLFLLIPPIPTAFLPSSSLKIFSVVRICDALNCGTRDFHRAQITKLSLSVLFSFVFGIQSFPFRFTSKVKVAVVLPSTVVTLLLRYYDITDFLIRLFDLLAFMLVDQYSVP